MRGKKRKNGKKNQEIPYREWANSSEWETCDDSEEDNFLEPQKKESKEKDFHGLPNTQKQHLVIGGIIKNPEHCNSTKLSANDLPNMAEKIPSQVGKKKKIRKEKRTHSLEISENDVLKEGQLHELQEIDGKKIPESSEQKIKGKKKRKSFNTSQVGENDSTAKDLHALPKIDEGILPEKSKHHNPEISDHEKWMKEKLREENIPAIGGNSKIRKKERKHNTPEVNESKEGELHALPTIYENMVAEFGGKRKIYKKKSKQANSTNLSENDESNKEELPKNGEKKKKGKKKRKSSETPEVSENKLKEKEFYAFPKIDEVKLPKTDGKKEIPKKMSVLYNSTDTSEDEEWLEKEYASARAMFAQNSLPCGSTNDQQQFPNLNNSSELTDSDDLGDCFYGFDYLSDNVMDNCFYALGCKSLTLPNVTTLSLPLPPTTPPSTPPPLIPILRKRRQITRKERWQKNIEFVNHICQIQPLYNRFHIDYNNPQVTDRLWLIISRRMTWSVDKCQRKWRYFKSIFRGCMENNRHHYLEKNMKFNLPYMTIFHDMAIPANKQFFTELDMFYKEFSKMLWSSLVEPHTVFEEKERKAIIHLKKLLYEGRMCQYKFSQEVEQQKQQQNHNAETSEKGPDDN